MLKHYNILLITILFFYSCSPAKKKDDKIRILCTTNILASTISEMISDTNLVVDCLMGPGVDPHLYKATQNDIFKMKDADVIVYNGLHLEGKMIEVLEKMKSYKEIINYSSLCNKENWIKIEGFDDAYDPHIWFDVNLWSSGLLPLEKELKNTLKSNIHFKTDSLLNSLKEVDSYVKLKVKEIPSEQRVLITAHDAFSYYGVAYGIKVRGLQGISTQSEYGLKDITELTNYIVENEIKAVFVEQSVPKRAIESVVEGVKRSGHQVILGGELYSDAIGGEKSPANSYINMIKYNTNTIVNSLK